MRKPTVKPRKTKIHAENTSNSKNQPSLTLDALEIVLKMCQLTSNLKRNEFKALIAFVIVSYANRNRCNTNAILEEIRQSVYNSTHNSQI